MQTASSGTREFTASDYGLTKALYGVSETLMILSIGRTLFYELVASGDLPITKFGAKKTLVAAPDIAALLNRRRQTATALEAA